MGRDLNWILCPAWKKCSSGTPLEPLPYNPDLTACGFWALPTVKRELWGKKFLSDWQPVACFWEALYEVHCLPREVLWKKNHHHTSTKFPHGVIRWVHELSKWPLYDKHNIWWNTADLYSTKHRIAAAHFVSAHKINYKSIPQFIALININKNKTVCVNLYKDIFINNY
jgi:hypothetical protein